MENRKFNVGDMVQIVGFHETCKRHGWCDTMNDLFGTVQKITGLSVTYEDSYRFGNFIFAEEDLLPESEKTKVKPAKIICKNPREITWFPSLQIFYLEYQGMILTVSELRAIMNDIAKKKIPNHDNFEGTRFLDNGDIKIGCTVVPKSYLDVIRKFLKNHKFKKDEKDKTEDR